MLLNLLKSVASQMCCFAECGGFASWPQATTFRVSGKLFNNNFLCHTI